MYYIICKEKYTWFFWLSAWSLSAWYLFDLVFFSFFLFFASMHRVCACECFLLSFVSCRIGSPLWIAWVDDFQWAKTLHYDFNFVQPHQYFGWLASNWSSSRCMFLFWQSVIIHGSFWIIDEKCVESKTDVEWCLHLIGVVTIAYICEKNWGKQ